MRRFISTIVLLSLFILPGTAQSQPPAQTGVDADVEAIFAEMDPAARVGQLFLVTFVGSDLGPDTDIATLITQYHIGGVVLLRQNNNFSSETDLPTQVQQLTYNLQAMNAGLTLPTAEPEEANSTATPEPTATLGPDALPGYVPLFIGIEHEGSDSSYLHLLSGVTPLPSNLALGATWDPSFAERVGQVVGGELDLLGINLLLGPPADVVEIPQPFATGDLGSRVFGGEPFWVSRMTAAYVRGVHEGSQGRIAVVPRHFPGYGGADRLASVEIPTVRRSRDQLTQFDLKPFFAVTGEAADPLAIADGLLVGHIRYQGFQGDNLRATTRPISLDPVALQSLMSLDPISRWRADGGLLISDSLGRRGVRRFYDPQEASFPARRVALDAFGAGNDVLYLGDFAASPSTGQLPTITDTIDFFLQRYQDDPAFRELVDQSVRRIIRTKLDLYGEFSPQTVFGEASGLDTLGDQREETFNVARNALTLLFPDQADLLAAPKRGDTIAIFTDTRTARQCSTCQATPFIAVDALRSAILRSYGPNATGIISFADIYPFGLDDLATFLEFGPQEPTDGATDQTELLPFALETADWVVFVVLDSNPDVASANVVKQFLAEPPVGPDTHIVVMAMGAPYYLDSTEVSKLTAYYALYGYTEPFIDVAARALFQEIAPMGSSPVSVGAIDYDILRATSPDPDQVISLFYEREGTAEEAALTPGAELLPQQGDTLRLTTGVIVDWNGHPVPDGTPVEFAQNYINEGLRSTQTFTVDGIAQASVVLDRPGELRITVNSGEARNSETLRLVVSETGSAEIAVLPPDITPTVSPTPTLTPAPEPTVPVEPTAATLAPTPEPAEAHSAVDFGDLFLTVLGLLLIAAVVFTIGFTRRDLNYGLLLALPAVVGGLLGYNYYAMVLPGAVTWHRWLGDSWGAGTAAWMAALLGLGLVNLAVYGWNRWIVTVLRNRQRR